VCWILRLPKFRDEQLAFIEEQATRLEARGHVMKVLNKHAEISVGEEEEEEEKEEEEEEGVNEEREWKEEDFFWDNELALASFASHTNDCSNGGRDQIQWRSQSSDFANEGLTNNMKRMVRSSQDREEDKKRHLLRRQERASVETIRKVDDCKTDECLALNSIRSKICQFHSKAQSTRHENSRIRKTGTKIEPMSFRKDFVSSTFDVTKNTIFEDLTEESEQKSHRKDKMKMFALLLAQHSRRQNLISMPRREGIIPTIAEIKIQNRQPHELGASVGEGIHKFFSDKNGQPPASIMITAEPGCTKLNVETFIAPNTHLRERRSYGNEQATSSRKLGKYAFEFGDAALGDVDVDIKFDQMRTKRVNGIWMEEPDIQSETGGEFFELNLDKHAICTDPQYTQSGKGEFTMSNVPKKAEVIVRVNGQVLREAKITCFGEHRSLNSSFLHISIPLDYAEGSLSISVSWDASHRKRTGLVSDPVLVMLSPNADLVHELQSALTEVNSLSKYVCNTLKRYFGTCFIKDRDFQSYRNPNFCTLQKDTTLWALENGFKNVSKRLLEPQVFALKYASSLLTIDEDYKTYVYAATLSESIETVREVISLGGDESLFGTVTSVGNLTTKDTALHVAAMRGNAELILYLLSVVDSIDLWYTLRNDNDFTPKELAHLAAQSSTCTSQALLRVLDAPLRIAANAVHFSYLEFRSEISHDGNSEDDETEMQNETEMRNEFASIDHIEQVEILREEVYPRTFELILESFDATEEENDEQLKMKQLQYLEIASKILADEENFLRLFSMAQAKERSEKLDGSCSTKKEKKSTQSTTSTSELSANAFFEQVQCGAKLGRFKAGCKLCFFLRRLNDYVEGKAIYAFSDPVVEKAFLLESSFNEQKFDVWRIMLIFSIFVGRHLIMLDESSEFKALSWFVLGAAFILQAIIIYALVVYSKFYVRYREYIIILLQFLFSLLVNISETKTDRALSSILLHFTVLTICSCRIERHLVTLFLASRLLFRGVQFSALAHTHTSSVLDVCLNGFIDFQNRIGHDNFITSLLVLLNFTIYLPLELRSRRQFAAKYAIFWMKREWLDDSVESGDQIYVKQIQEEIDSRGNEKCFSRYVSNQMKKFQAKACFSFPNPNHEREFILDSAIMHRPYDCGLYFILSYYVVAMFLKLFNEEQGGFKGIQVALFTSCIYDKEMMHDINIADDPYLSSTTVTPMFLLKTFSLFVPAICLSIGIFFPRFYCLHRGLIVMAMRNICPWSAYVKSDYPQILNLVVYRSTACIMNVRLERHILSLFLNHVVQPYFISRYMVETIISSGQSCKGNNIILQASIFSTDYPLAASLPLGLLFGFAQVLIPYHLEQSRRRTFALKKREQKEAAKKVI